MEKEPPLIHPRTSEKPGRNLEGRLSNTAIKSSGIEFKHQREIDDFIERRGQLNIKVADFERSPNSINYAEEYQECHMDDIMLGYIIGLAALEDFRNYPNYLNRKEAQFLVDSEKFESDDRNKNYYLMQIHNRLLGRVERGKTPQDNLVSENGGVRREYGQLTEYIKTNYVMNLNEEIRNYIDNSDHDNNYPALYKNLKLRTNSATKNLIENNGAVKIAIDYGKYDAADVKKIAGVINGIRHEEAFAKLIKEAQVDDNIELISIKKASKRSDSRGIDFFLDAKLSSRGLSENKYIFASKEEIELGEYSTKTLPVDIKASEKTAQKALDKQKAGGILRSPHWVMWSHVYGDDFRLSFQDNEPMLDVKKAKSAIFLESDQHIAAMKNLKDIRYYSEKDDIYVDPPSLDTRFGSMKSEILSGIEALDKCKQLRQKVS